VNRGKVLFLVRTGRARTRPSESAQIERDTPDHPINDTVVARRAAADLPAVIFLRQEGAEAQGWCGCPFWWPVVMIPANTRTTLFAHAR